MTDKKSQLGQFFTVNYEYILSNMEIPKYVKKIVEPFVGNGDLLKFVKNKEDIQFELYDIDPKIDNVITQDTLLNPPQYKNKFVLTNPPYLARNKNSSKNLYNKYDCNDLYKCFILSLIGDVCDGGIIIVPLNFLSSIRKADIELRKNFLNVYNIKLINIFEESVFEDTNYSVCSIQFNKINNDSPSNTNDCINACIYPSMKNMELKLTSDTNYTIGGEIYNIPINTEYKIQRATKDNMKNLTNILLKCIDDNINNQLGFKIVDDKNRYIDYTSKLSARSYATLTINKSMSINEQQILVNKMNEYIKIQRNKYHSLFLTNYRESNTIARKRISFELAFRICNYILSNE
jgi:hypothetical protein